MQVSSGSIAALLMAALVTGVIIVGGARAQEHDGHGAGHEKNHDFYKEWMQPNTNLSCCNAKTIYRGGDGKPLGHRGDCYATRFRVNPLKDKKGHSFWLAELDDEDREIMKQRWIEVPDSKVIREKNPDPTGADGHLCISNGAVLCAVPPTGAM